MHYWAKAGGKKSPVLVDNHEGKRKLWNCGACVCARVWGRERKRDGGGAGRSSRRQEKLFKNGKSYILNVFLYEDSPDQLLEEDPDPCCSHYSSVVRSLLWVCRRCPATKGWCPLSQLWGPPMQMSGSYSGTMTAFNSMTLSLRGRMS